MLGYVCLDLQHSRAEAGRIFALADVCSFNDLGKIKGSLTVRASYSGIEALGCRL